MGLQSGEETIRLVELGKELQAGEVKRWHCLVAFDGIFKRGWCRWAARMPENCLFEESSDDWLLEGEFAELAKDGSEGGHQRVDSVGAHGRWL